MEKETPFPPRDPLQVAAESKDSWDLLGEVAWVWVQTEADHPAHPSSVASPNQPWVGSQWLGLTKARQGCVTERGSVGLESWVAKAICGCPGVIQAHEPSLCEHIYFLVTLGGEGMSGTLIFLFLFL